jgi:23S rRNA (guanine745-N1)-methyltransferase
LTIRPDIVRLLACPHCGSGFSSADRSLRCAAGHSFDIARQGYVNLVPGDSRPGTGDTASMVHARETFLESGHFSRLRDAVAEAAARAVLEAGSKPPPAGLKPKPGSAGCVIDVGAGTGYYLAGVLDRLPDRIGLALDLSKSALRRAARAHERLGAAACDTWRRLPVRDNCAALVLDVFAPRNPPEFRRIIEPEGRLLIVTPTNRHLMELIPLLGMLGVDTRKQDRLDAKVSGDFALVAATDYEESLMLTRTDAATLVGMGPSAYHIPNAELKRRTAELEETTAVSVSVTISVYRPV